MSAITNEIRESNMPRNHRGDGALVKSGAPIFEAYPQVLHGVAVVDGLDAAGNFIKSAVLAQRAGTGAAGRAIPANRRAIVLAAAGDQLDAGRAVGAVAVAFAGAKADPKMVQQAGAAGARVGVGRAALLSNINDSFGDTSLLEGQRAGVARGDRGACHAVKRADLIAYRRAMVLAGGGEVGGGHTNLAGPATSRGA